MSTVKQSGIKLLDKAGIEAAIKSIAGRGAKLDNDIHIAAVSALAHLDAHNDTTFCNRLLKAMPKSGRKNALAAWMVAYGKLSINDNKETKAEQPLVFSKESVTQLEQAQSTPFWEFKASEGGATFAMDTYLATVQKRLQTAVKAEIDPVKKAHAESILALMATMPLNQKNASAAFEPAML